MALRINPRVKMKGSLLAFAAVGLVLSFTDALIPLERKYCVVRDQAVNDPQAALQVMWQVTETQCLYRCNNLVTCVYVDYLDDKTCMLYDDTSRTATANSGSAHFQHRKRTASENCDSGLQPYVFPGPILSLKFCYKTDVTCAGNSLYRNPQRTNCENKCKKIRECKSFVATGDMCDAKSERCTNGQLTSSPGSVYAFRLEEGETDCPAGYADTPSTPAKPGWQRLLDLMIGAETLPVYNPYFYCSSSAQQKMQYISKSCQQGTCPLSEVDCQHCLGCVNDHWRSLNGACNNKDNVFSGIGGSPFERNIPISKLGIEVPIDEPNVRLVSHKLLARDNGFVKHKTLSLLGVAYYQFQFHDFLQRGLDPATPVNIDVPQGDPLSGQLGTITILGTQFKSFGCPFSKFDKFSQDVATAWVDGSQLYGSSAETNSNLRTGIGGHIRLDENQRLEFENESPVTGHPGGFWIGLYTFHTLFIREHNTICDMLHEQYPVWDDEQLFNHARLINSAMIFKFFLSSLLPALQPTHETAVMAKWLWSGVGKEDILNGAPDLGDVNQVYPGIFGQPDQDTSKYLTTAEDLGAVNRLHAFVPDNLEIFDHGSAHPQTLSPTSGVDNTYSALDFSFEFTENVKAENSDEDLLYSMAIAESGAVVLNNYPETYTRTTATVNEADSPTMTEMGWDMSMADVLRDRERGTPRYCQYLRALGKQPPATFLELTKGDQNLADKLEDVYDDIEKVDLLIALHLSSQVENDGLIPPLTMEFLYAHLYRKISSDRFFTSDFTAEKYTMEGLYWIRHNDLNSVICRHYDSLCRHVEGLANPLAVWDDDVAQVKAQSVQF